MRTGSARAAAIALAALGLAASGCPSAERESESASEAEPRRAPAYQPDRRDYARFVDAHPGVVDPNYLPFMLHHAPADDGSGDWLFVCRWSEDDMPIPVFVDMPDIPDSLQDEFRPVEPVEYGRAVERALASWEKSLEGRVSFRRVADPDEALLTVRVLGELAPETEDGAQVLGSTESLLGACRVEGPVGPGDEPLAVSFRVPELDLYMADRAGLLTPHQVEMVALHEIGHALGMQGHSPLPTDFMYPAFRDQASVKGLSETDVHSFLALYSVPNGARFAFAPLSGAPEPLLPRPATARPLLDAAPHVDATRGFEISLPEGWMRIATERGLFAADGPIWDRDASIEIGLWPYATVGDFVGRFGPVLFEGTRLIADGRMVIEGRRARFARVSADEGRREQEFVFVELGDGRLMMILSDAPAEFGEDWRPWFRDILASLEIWEVPGESR